MEYNDIKLIQHLFILIGVCILFDDFDLDMYYRKKNTD